MLAVLTQPRAVAELLAGQEGTGQKTLGGTAAEGPGDALRARRRDPDDGAMDAGTAKTIPQIPALNSH